MHPPTGTTVRFTHLKDATADDWALLRGHELAYVRQLPDRLLAALRQLDEDTIHGYQVSRLEHSLQTATRAEADGADDEMVVAALLHDVGDGLAPVNHAAFAATIVQPYVRPEVTWVVRMHGLFQVQFYGMHVGLPVDGHLKHRAHPWFDSAQRFVERWDQAAFEPRYPTRSLAHFEARLRTIFTREPFDPNVVGAEAAATAA